MKHVVLVNPNTNPQCGVYQFGVLCKKNIEAGISENTYTYLEVSPDISSLKEIKDLNPDVVLYNYYAPWVHPGIQQTILAGHFCPTATFIHDVWPNGLGCGFDGYITINPLLDTAALGPNFFRVTRPLPVLIDEKAPDPAVFTIGSFGFAFANKGFDNLVSAVSREFAGSKKEVVVRLHVTRAHFNGGQAMTDPKQIESVCRANLGVPVQLDFRSNFINDPSAIVDFLATNSINALFYHPNPGRGPSSAVDYCVASERPLLLTECAQFSHVQHRLPIYDPNSSMNFLETYRAGNQAVLDLKRDWSPQNFVDHLDQVVSALTS